MSDVEIEYLAGANSVDLLPQHYPDGMPLINLNERRYHIDRVMIRPKTLDTLVTGLFFIDAIAERGDRVSELVLPCLPGARQDRINTTGDFLFTAKSIARMINERGFDQVICLDPHSEVMPGLIDRCYSIPALHAFRYYFDRALPEPRWHWDAVIAPDAGAEKRASKIAQYLGVPMLHAWKTRDVKDGSITGFGIQPTHGKPDSRLLVVDDICDGGGTFLGLAQLMDPWEVKVDLFVTHGIFSHGTEQLLKAYDKIYCTDSLIAERPGVTVIPVREQLLREGTL